MAQAADPTPTADATEDTRTPRWVRVRDKATGHTYDLAPSQIRQDAHERVNAPKAYPDLYGDGDQPRPPKFRTTKAGQPVFTSQNQES